MTTLREKQQKLTMIAVCFLTDNLNALISIQGTILPSLFRILRQRREMVNSATAKKIAANTIASDKRQIIKKLS